MRTPLSLLLLLASAAAGSLGSHNGIAGLGSPGPRAWDNTYIPLGGYVHIGKPLHSNLRVELLFMGDQFSSSSLTEEWPVVKALDQFGTFSGVTPLEGAFAPATFNLDRARFSSRYVSFVYRDLDNRSGTCLVRRLNAGERRLFLRYNHPVHRTFDADMCKYLDNDPDHHPIPLLFVGGYLLRGNFITVVGDFQTPTNPTSGSPYGGVKDLTFDEIRAAIRSGHDTAGSALVYHVDSEANIIAALICHADGGRPASVCNRAPVKETLRHVR